MINLIVDDHLDGVQKYFTHLFVRQWFNIFEFIALVQRSEGRKEPVGKWATGD